MTRLLKFETILEATDLYQEQLPSFNLRGRKTIPSLAGALVSLLVYLIVFLYAYKNLGRLLNRSNPEISEFQEYGVLTSDETVNVEEIGFKFAFAIEGYRDQ